jgi:MFS family permease
VGTGRQYTLLSELAGAPHRLAVNAVVGTATSISVIAGPALAGALIGPIGPGWLIAADALSFAYLGITAWRTRPPAAAAAEEVIAVDTRKASAGLRVIRAHRLLGLLTLTWLFFFLYGPVEVALPVHVKQDLHAGAGTLGIYWSLFGLGGLLGSLATIALRNRPPWSTVLVIVTGWGLCLIPFGFGPPTFVTMIGFGVGGLIYGPFTPLTYKLFQSAIPAAQLPTVLAARSALLADP